MAYIILNHFKNDTIPIFNCKRLLLNNDRRIKCQKCLDSQLFFAIILNNYVSLGLQTNPEDILINFSNFKNWNTNYYVLRNRTMSLYGINKQIILNLKKEYYARH